MSMTFEELDQLNYLQVQAMLIAMGVRNAMEDFHCEHLTDAQMQELNPIIRNAIYTAMYALANYENKDIDIARRYVDFNAMCLPKYWEAPELIDALAGCPPPGNTRKKKTSHTKTPQQ